jgi:hypothetical protein
MVFAQSEKNRHCNRVRSFPLLFGAIQDVVLGGHRHGYDLVVDAFWSTPSSLRVAMAPKWYSSKLRWAWTYIMSLSFQAISQRCGVDGLWPR